MTIHTYDPTNISVTVAGRNLSNFADTFVKIALSGDNFTLIKGADGEGTRNYNADRSGEVTITLKGSSEDNLFLSGLAATDLLTKLGTFPIFIKDNNGSSIYTAAEAWVKKTADAEFGKEVSDREWVFSCNELLMVNGGNN